MKLAQKEYNILKSWIYRNARPLDLARWKYHFEQGPADDVIEALSAYQNEDGGFGHALEADSWNPLSTPIQTTTAIEKLMEIHFNDDRHPMIQGILRYLASGADYEEGRWKNTVFSNNDYPHAPWWHTDSSSSSHSEYNPSAIIAGFILKFADRDSRLYGQGMDLAQELAALYIQDPEIEMHPLKCFTTLLELIEQAELQQDFAFSQLQAVAARQIHHLITRDLQDWDGYSTRPSVFIHSPESAFYTANQIFLEQELDYLLNGRNEAGVWDITWVWSAYEREFAISENWWKADVVIRNLLLLRDFQRV